MNFSTIKILSLGIINSNFLESSINSFLLLMQLVFLKKEIKLLQQDKVNLVNELKQLKEKHNNQFRLQDKE